jgi:GDP-L-fucose synthase
MELKDKKILITGSDGMVGKALVKILKEEGCKNFLLPNYKELDLRNQNDVKNYFEYNKPEYVFHLASKVGGISANINSPAEFLYDNLAIEINVIESARENSVEKLLFLGSSCIYPRECPQPMKEEDLLTGKLEPTNEGYALAKISGLKMCEYYNKQYGTNFINLMPPNMYGPNDHFDEEKSHVVSSIITKFSNAKENRDKFVEIWGTGNSRREFLYVEDAADAIVYFMKNYSAREIGPFINIGFGEDISIKNLAFLIREMIGYSGEIIFDKTKPDGMPKKLLDSSKAANLGWKAKTSLKEGLEKTLEWYSKNK